MSMKQYYGKTIRITAQGGRVFIGKVTDYVYPEDNENGKESIIIDATDGTPYEFYSGDTRSIEIIP